MKKKVFVQEVEESIGTRIGNQLAYGVGEPLQISKEKLAFLITHYLNSLGDFATPSYRAARIANLLKECNDHVEIDHTLAMELQGSEFQQMFIHLLKNE